MLLVLERMTPLSDMPLQYNTVAFSALTSAQQPSFALQLSSA